MTDPKFAIAVHGGAGVIERGRITPDVERAYRAGLEAALNAGACAGGPPTPKLRRIVAPVSSY